MLGWHGPDSDPGQPPIFACVSARDVSHAKTQRRSSGTPSNKAPRGELQPNGVAARPPRLVLFAFDTASGKVRGMRATLPPLIIDVHGEGQFASWRASSPGDEQGSLARGCGLAALNLHRELAPAHAGSSCGLRQRSRRQTAVANHLAGGGPHRPSSSINARATAAEADVSALIDSRDRGRRRPRPSAGRGSSTKLMMRSADARLLLLDRAGWLVPISPISEG